MKDTVAQSLANTTEQLKGKLASLTGQIELHNNIATITQVRVTFRQDYHSDCSLQSACTCLRLAVTKISHLQPDRRRLKSQKYHKCRVIHTGISMKSENQAKLF